MRAAIYSRYSTDKQNPLSTQDQVDACLRYAQSQNWTVAADTIFKDAAMSGGSMIDRTEFNRMLSKAKQGAFDVIVVEAIDRFTRDFDDGMVEIIGLKRSGVKIADIHTGIKDLESLAGKMGIFVDLIGSEDFRKRAGEKTKRGQLAQLQNGYRPGGPSPFGYVIVRKEDRNEKTGEIIKKNSKLVIDPEKSEIVKEVFMMHANGTGIGQIAKHLNKNKIPTPRKNNHGWDPTAIRSMLHNPVYIGTTVYGRHKRVKLRSGKSSMLDVGKENWIIFENTHPAIINQELWDKVQARVQISAAKYPKQKRHEHFKGRTTPAYTKYLLSGLMKCGHCGANIVITIGGPRYAKYGCAFNYRRGSTICQNDLKIPRQEIELAVFNALKTKIFTKDNVAEVVQMVNEKLAQNLSGKHKEIAKIKSEIDGQKSILNRLMKSIEDSDTTPTSIIERIKEVELKIKESRSSLLELEKIHKADLITVSDSDVSRYFESFHGFIDKPSYELKEWLSKVVKQITVEIKTNVEGMKYGCTSKMGDLQ